jgi:hypothetical protein
LITGSKRELMVLEDELRKLLPSSQFYLCFNNEAWVREQALINLSLIRSNNYKIIDYSFNHQLLYLPLTENACLHLNAPESKKVYDYLVEEQCDDVFRTLNKNLFEDYIENSKFKNVLCIGDMDFEKKISNNNWTELKNLSKDTNSFDCVVYDHFDDLSNTKIKLYLINKILNEGILVVLTAKENLEIFNLLDIEYELLGTDFGREIIVIEK